MNKYLIIVDFNTGYTEISNVSIIMANSKEQAKNNFIEITNKKYKDENLYIIDIENVRDNWTYYM